MTLFDPPPVDGCTCKTGVAHLLIAELTEAEGSLCPVHEANAIKRRDARADADQQRQVLDEMKATDELARRRKAKAEHDRAIDSALASIEDPLEQSLSYLLAGRRPIPAAPTGGDLPLGLPTSAYPSLAGFTDTDGPDAA